MMDIFGLGSNDKDIIFSYASERAVENYLLENEKSIGASFRYRGLAMVLSFSTPSFRVYRTICLTIILPPYTNTGVGIPTPV